MVNLMIADDHQIFRQGVKRLLSDHEDFAVVADAGNYAEVLRGFHDHRIDVAILDLSMPGRDGIELIAHVKSLQPNARTLVLTMHGEDPYVSQALRAGTDGYMTKEHAAEDLVVVIRRLMAGGRYVSPAIAERLALELVCHTGEGSDHTRLSRREYRVFELLVVGKRGSEIARELSLSEKTVSTHKAHVMRKLKAENSSDLVRYAVRHHLVAP
jgi:DNA-binding NarL/FixJ family response regulator